MSLAELLKTHGQAIKVRHYGIANGVPMVIVAEDNGHYFVKFDTDKYATITPKEAESGWTLFIRDVPVRSCAWRFLHPMVDVPVERFEFRENINPWECELLEKHHAFCSDMKELKNWHRCDDEDVVLKETR